MWLFRASLTRSKVIDSEFGGQQKTARRSRKTLLAFLRNHREAIVALDFFTVPTVNYCVLYCLFVIEHAQRRMPHFHVTSHPNSDWVVQQLRQTFPDSAPYRYAIPDREPKLDTEALRTSLRLAPGRRTLRI
jgi:hypothetical protein